MKRRSLAAITVTILLTLTACSAVQEHEDKRGRGDAPVAGRTGDDSPAFCTNMPDQFGNVCGKCIDHFPPYAFVVTTTGTYSPSNMVVFQAPAQCGGKVVSGAPPVIGTSNTGDHPEDDS